MPSEPENKIEPLLKAFAEKRRQAARPDPVMPEATRALLQAEASQRWPMDSASAPASPTAIGPESTSGSWWDWISAIKTFWPRLAVAGAILLMMAVGVWMLSPARTEQNFAAAKPSPPNPREKAEAEVSRIALQDRSGSRPAPLNEPAAPFPNQPVPANSFAFSMPVGSTTAPAKPGAALLAVTDTKPAGPMAGIVNFGDAEGAAVVPQSPPEATLRTKLQSSGIPVVVANPVLPATVPPPTATPARAPSAVDRSLVLAQSESRVSPASPVTVTAVPAPTTAPLPGLQANQPNQSYRSDVDLQAAVQTKSLEEKRAAPVALADTAVNRTAVALNKNKDNAGRYYTPPSASSGAAVAQQIESFKQTTGAQTQFYFQNQASSESAARPTMRARGAGDPVGQRTEMVRSPSTVGPMLLNFAVEPSGSTVRVIDSDGSIYAGRFLPIAARTSSDQAADKPANGFDTYDRAATPNEVKRRLTYAAPSPQGGGLARPAVPSTTASNQTWAFSSGRPALDFEVMGTNATLGQSVVFTGTMVMELVLTNSTNDALGRSQTGLGAARDKESNQAGVGAGGGGGYSLKPGYSAGGRVLRVQGRGRFGGTNEVPVDAVPAQR